MVGSFSLRNAEIPCDYIGGAAALQSLPQSVATHARRRKVVEQAPHRDCAPGSGSTDKGVQPSSRLPPDLRARSLPG